MEQSQTLPACEVERMMKLQDVISEAIAKKLSWIEAAESWRNFLEGDPCQRYA